MRKLFPSLAAAAVTMAAAALIPSNASAAFVAPSAMRPAAVNAKLVHNVGWSRMCHYHWRHNDTHCRVVRRHGHYHHHHHHRWHYRY